MSCSMTNYNHHYGSDEYIDIEVRRFRFVMPTNALKKTRAGEIRAKLAKSGNLVTNLVTKYRNLVINFRN